MILSRLGQSLRISGSLYEASKFYDDLFGVVLFSGPARHWTGSGGGRELRVFVCQLCCPGFQDFLQVGMIQHRSCIRVTGIGFKTVHKIVAQWGERIFSAPPQKPGTGEKRDTHYASPKSVHGGALHLLF